MATTDQTVSGVPGRYANALFELASEEKAVDKVARHIREKFEIDAQWNRNTLEFSRSGVEGEIAVEIDSVSVHADISWLLLPIKGAIESEIRRYLEQEFGD